MQYRRLGNAGVKFSVIGLGSWLTFGNSVEKKQARACVKTAIEYGINFFDTADAYAAGAAETALGEFLQDFPRSDLVIATKCFFPMGGGPNDRGLSRKHIFESIDGSLKRLRMDYVDLFQCHRYDEETPLEETVRAMDDLIRQGKILYWGVSQWSATQIQRACDLAERLNAHRPQSNQPIYNIINRSLEIEVMRTCHDNGMGLLVYSPLAQGVLTGKYKVGHIPPNSRGAHPQLNQFMRKRLAPEWLQKVEQLSALAKELGVSTAQLSLAWVLRLPVITSAIIGATRHEQIEENVKAVGVELSQEVLEKIDEIMGTAPVDQYTGERIVAL